MASRMRAMRSALREGIERSATPGQWSHITEQCGMFCYTGLGERQVQHLLDRYHIYAPKDGRISLCGLNTTNVEYVAKAISDCVHQSDH